ncbi:MAG: TraB/GumN family protein [Salinirussus sp.]
MTDRGPVGPAEEWTVPTPVEPSGPDGEREGSVTVVGTAHVSEHSVAEVEETIERERPEMVAVELDDARYRRLAGEDPEEIDATDLIRGRTVFQFLAYWILSYIQQRLGDRFDVEPGADMLAAVDAAERVGAGVALVDRDIQVTIRRFWSRLRAREKVAMLVALIAGSGGPVAAGLGIGGFVGLFVALPAEIVAGPLLLPAGLAGGVPVPVVGGLVGTLVTVADGLLVAGAVALAVGVPIVALLSVGDVVPEEEAGFDMADLTDADVVTAMMEEFRRFSPGGAEALIDERDAYIAHRLVALREAGYDVVAVVGAGHREGIEAYLADPSTLPPVESLVGEPTTPRWKGLLYKTVGSAFTVGFVVFFVLLAMAGVRQGWLLTVLAAWFLVNGVVAAGLALVAGAHPTSAAVGGAVAWLTSVNPLLAPGWFAGYVELRYLDVSVADISRLNDLLSDEEQPLGELFGRMREVPLFRLILVVALTNVGSFVASVLFAAVFLPYFSTQIGGVDALAAQMVEGAANSAELIWGTLT